MITDRRFPKWGVAAGSGNHYKVQLMQSFSLFAWGLAIILTSDLENGGLLQPNVRELQIGLKLALYQR